MHCITCFEGTPGGLEFGDVLARLSEGFNDRL